MSVEKHLEVAHRFYTLSDTMSAATGDTAAWSIVLAFYPSVHWVRGYIRHKNPSAQLASHDDVRRAFEDYPELRRIKSQYDSLKRLSRNVRYYGDLAFDGHSRKSHVWPGKCAIGQGRSAKRLDGSSPRTTKCVRSVILRS